MSLSPGTRLGHYNVSALIGEGGMGQVWQATDTQLNRQVALKILPDAFADDPDRLARFQREAQVLASLNHPNIAAIHGIEEADGTRALVLELVEGPTLADRIAKGPIPIDEALPIARQIAEALEAAHEQGVIHRDLKPANVKVRDDGTVKVLDFGLAKALDPSPSADPDLSPTLTAAATQMGVIMGTAAYMSPEQAKGKAVDKRADVWAFGAVLYEMVTGRKIYEAGDVSEMLASVVLKDPDLSGLGSSVPPNIQSLLRRCLVKDPRNRLRDIGEVRLTLNEAAAPASDVAIVGAGIPATPLRVWQQPLPALLAIGVVAIIGALVGTRLPSSRPADGSGDVLRLAIATLEGEPVDAGFGGRGLVISPDGTQIVYVGPAIDGDFGTNLYRRALDEFDAEPIDGSAGASDPFFSPDGEWVGFTVSPGGRLLKVPTVGGIQELVAVMPAGIRGASWNSSNQIIVGGLNGGLAEVPADGGDPTSLTTLDANRAEVGHSSPAVTPDGRGVLFVIREAARTEGLLAVLDRATGQVTRLGLAGTNPRYVSSGHLVYASPDGPLTAVSFDPERLELQGRPVAVVEGLWIGNGYSGASYYGYGVSDAGRLVYVSGTAGELELAWVDRSGRTIGRIEDQPLLRRPSLSPDGRRLAFIDATGTVAILDLDRGGAVKLSEGGTAFTPAWSADGSAVTYSATRETTINLYSRPADFSGPEELLLERPETLIAGGWSSDGQPSSTTRRQAPPIATSGRYCRTAKPDRCVRPSSTKLRPGCLRTGAGWHSCPTRMAGTASTCSPSAGAGSFRSRPDRETNRSGLATAASCSIVTTTA